MSEFGSFKWCKCGLPLCVGKSYQSPLKMVVWGMVHVKTDVPVCCWYGMQLEINPYWWCMIWERGSNWTKQSNPSVKAERWWECGKLLATQIIFHCTFVGQPWFVNSSHKLYRNSLGFIGISSHWSTIFSGQQDTPEYKSLWIKMALLRGKKVAKDVSEDLRRKTRESIKSWKIRWDEMLTEKNTKLTYGLIQINVLTFLSCSTNSNVHILNVTWLLT